MEIYFFHNRIDTNIFYFFFPFSRASCIFSRKNKQSVKKSSYRSKFVSLRNRSTTEVCFGLLFEKLVSRIHSKNERLISVVFNGETFDRRDAIVSTRNCQTVVDSTTIQQQSSLSATREGKGLEKK